MPEFPIGFWECLTLLVHLHTHSLTSTQVFQNEIYTSLILTGWKIPGFPREVYLGVTLTLFSANGEMVGCGVATYLPNGCPGD